MQFSADSAAVLTANLTGINLELATSVTATGFNVVGVDAGLPNVTNTGAGTYAYTGFQTDQTTLIQNTLGGVTTFTGFQVDLPDITQATGTVNSYGVHVSGGAVTSGTEYGLFIENTSNLLSTAGASRRN